MKIFMQRVLMPNNKPDSTSKKYRWRWQIARDNGTVIATSVFYVTRQTAEKSLADLRAECVNAPRETIIET